MGMMVDRRPPGQAPIKKQAQTLLLTSNLRRVSEACQVLVYSPERTERAGRRLVQGTTVQGGASG